MRRLWRTAAAAPTTTALDVVAWLALASTAILLIYSLALVYQAIGAQSTEIQVTGSLREEWQRASANAYLSLQGNLHNVGVALLGALWASVLVAREGRRGRGLPFWGAFSCATLALVFSLYVYYRFSTYFAESAFLNAFSPNSALAVHAWEAQSLLLVTGAVGTATVLVGLLGETK